jgi:CDP-diacylglycerol--glycerol-3-phosphate 3-phosphatidyltransferase
MSLYKLTLRRPAGGLYVLKPTLQRRLLGTATWLAARRVNPDLLTLCAVLCASLSGLALAAGLARPVLLWAVPPLACLRLALNALDGMVAKRREIARPWGKVLNEFCDRLADLAFLWPLLLVPDASPALVTAALCAMLLVSFLGVLAEAAGAGRQYGGVMGKADRMLWLALACMATAATGQLLFLRVLPTVLLLGATITLIQRGTRTHAAL